MKLPQMHDDQKIKVFMDERPADNAKITGDGKTIKLDMFIPPEEHQIQILGVAHKAT
jgi:hypothetical protein